MTDEHIKRAREPINMYTKLTEVFNRHKVLVGIIAEDAPDEDSFRLHFMVEDTYLHTQPEKTGIILTAIMEAIADISDQTGLNIVQKVQLEDPSANTHQN